MHVALPAETTVIPREISSKRQPIPDYRNVNGERDTTIREFFT